MSKPNFSRGSISVPRTGEGGPNVSKKKSFTSSCPLILIPEETSVVLRQDGTLKCSLTFYSRLSTKDLHSIGMGGPIKIQHSWFLNGNEQVYRPNIFVEFDYSENDQEEFYWAYEYTWFINAAEAFKEKLKTVVIFVKDTDPDTSRGTETTVQQGGG